MLFIERKALNGLMDREGYRSDMALSHAAGISPVTLSWCINKTQKPGTWLVDTLCDILNCQPGDFLRYESTPCPQDMPDD